MIVFLCVVFCFLFHVRVRFIFWNLIVFSHQIHQMLREEDGEIRSKDILLKKKTIYVNKSIRSTYKDSHFHWENHQSIPISILKKNEWVFSLSWSILMTSIKMNLFFFLVCVWRWRKNNNMTIGIPLKFYEKENPIVMPHRYQLWN